MQDSEDSYLIAVLADVKARGFVFAGGSRGPGNCLWLHVHTPVPPHGIRYDDVRPRLYGGTT